MQLAPTRLMPTILVVHANITQYAHCLQWVIQWHMPHGPHVYWQEFYPYLGSCLLSGPLGAMEAVDSVRVGLPAHRAKGVARNPV